MSLPCPCTPTIGTQLARLMTRSAPTPAPIAVATFVILFSKLPLVHAPGYTSFLSSRLWPGQQQAECGRGATLCLNRSLVPRIVTTPQEVRVFPPPSTSLMSLSQASRWPERAPSRQHSWNRLRLSASCGDQDFGRVFRGSWQAAPSSQLASRQREPIRSNGRSFRPTKIIRRSTLNARRCARPMNPCRKRCQVIGPNSVSLQPAVSITSTRSPKRSTTKCFQTWSSTTAAPRTCRPGNSARP